MLAVITIVVICSFALQNTSSTKANDNIQILENCLNTDLSNHNYPEKLSCDETSKKTIRSIKTTSSSLLNFIYQKRFLTIVSENLQTLPEPESLEYILLRFYGVAYINRQPGIKLPGKLMFANEKETKEFQATLNMGKVNGTRNCYLQKPAADALNRARAQIKIPLMSRYGQINCTRSFSTTLRLWRKYANNRTLEKIRQGKETKILSIVAPPGTSQHLWGLAVDLRVTNQAQQKVLNQNGWFRTVVNDTPHWTYTGTSREELALLGFKNQVIRGVNYWLTPL